MQKRNNCSHKIQSSNELQQNMMMLVTKTTFDNHMQKIIHTIYVYNQAQKL